MNAVDVKGVSPEWEDTNVVSATAVKSLNDSDWPRDYIREEITLDNWDREIVNFEDTSVLFHFLGPTSYWWSVKDVLQDIQERALEMYRGYVWEMLNVPKTVIRLKRKSLRNFFHTVECEVYVNGFSMVHRKKVIKRKLDCVNKEFFVYIYFFMLLWRIRYKFLKENDVRVFGDRYCMDLVHPDYVDEYLKQGDGDKATGLV